MGDNDIKASHSHPLGAFASKSIQLEASRTDFMVEVASDHRPMGNKIVPRQRGGRIFSKREKGEARQVSGSCEWFLLGWQLE